MDRQIVYPGQILPETALLQMAKDTMIGSAKLATAMLGTSTIANGFAVTPTGPASLQIVVAPGEIYAMANVDSLAFSTLPADTTHSILKQGIMLDGVTLSCPAPTTTGQSINYLVQVTYQDQDSTPVLLPYYNSANPALPYSGMGNNGMTQNTARKGVAIVQVKAGASAATGSQVTPAPDSGYVGLFVATVAYGQTTITSGNITQYAGAPLLPSGVLQSIQGGNTTYALDTGAVNACAATFFPAITSLVDGLTLRFKAANSNTGAATFSPNGISAAPIVGGNHAALQGGEIAATGDVWVQWNSSVGAGSWVLVESSGGGLQVASGTKSQHAISAGQAQAQSVTAFTTAGVSTALTLTPVPAITAYAANQRFRLKLSQASTGADTINVSGLGAKSLKQYDSTGAKIPAVFAVGQLADVEYDGTDFVILDQLPSSSGVTPSQFDNSIKLATTAFIRGVGLQFSNYFSLGANTTLTAAAHAGAIVVGNSASAINATLPLASTMPAGAVIKFWNFLSGVMTIVASGSDVIYSPSGAASFPMQKGEFVTLVSTGAAWLAVDSNSKPIGEGQVWGDFTLSRSLSTVFTNTSGRTIGVMFEGISSSASACALTINGSLIRGGVAPASLQTGSGLFLVPNGATYSASGITTMNKWWELK